MYFTFYILLGIGVVGLSLGAFRLETIEEGEYGFLLGLCVFWPIWVLTMSIITTYNWFSGLFEAGLKEAGSRVSKQFVETEEENE